ncbi:MAG TPA: hypothetical protein VMF07_17190 [Solirubrobacteraceae bacterium]|nr:hypothetical protein [Solirubrobacteraceae bacterium]
MSSLLTTMRQRLADAENDAERLRAAIQILERAETTSAPSPRRERRRNQAATATVTRSRPAQPEPKPAAADGEPPKAQPAAASPKATPAPRKRKPATKKAAKTVVPLAKLLKVVGDNPGMTTSALAKQTGGDQPVLLELLKESEQKGEVRRQGERRATSWYRITDEDRIAARAAEIAAQSAAHSKGGAKAPAKRRKVSAAR